MPDAKRLPNGRSTTAVRLDPENYEGLKKASEGFGLPMNFLINYAIREFLDRMIEPRLLRLTHPPSHSAPTAAPTSTPEPQHSDGSVAR